jgi:hypothetical protein
MTQDGKCKECGGSGMDFWCRAGVVASFTDPLRYGPPKGRYYSNGDMERLFAPCEFCNTGSDVPNSFSAMTEVEVRVWAEVEAK